MGGYGGMAGMAGGMMGGGGGGGTPSGVSGFSSMPGQGPSTAGAYPMTEAQPMGVGQPATMPMGSLPRQQPMWGATPLGFGQGGMGGQMGGQQGQSTLMQLIAFFRSNPQLTQALLGMGAGAPQPSTGGMNAYQP